MRVLHGTSWTENDRQKARAADSLCLVASLLSQHPRLHQQYAAAKLRHLGPDWPIGFPSSAGSLPAAAEVVAYHGTKATDPALIVRAGFDTSFGRAKPGHLWFSAASEYSANAFSYLMPDGRQQQIFRCSLLALPNELVLHTGKEHELLA